MRDDSKLPRILTANELMDRWNRNIHEITELVRNHNLPANRGYERLDPNSAILAMVSNCTFNLPDVKQFEKEHKELRPKKTKPLTPEEARELGQLRVEKEKWNKSIDAAVQLALFCSKQNSPVTRRQDELSLRLKLDIPNTTFEKIWKAIPNEMRNLGGRPKSSS